MKAAVWTDYGPPEVLRLQEVDEPLPKANEVRIRVHATTVETGDCELRRYEMHNRLLLLMRLYFGLIRPTRIKILGQQLSGEIESVGKEVTLFKEGDPVFAPTASFGAYAQYLCLPSTHTMAIKPANMTFEEAAAVPVGGLNALHFLRAADIQRGDKVLIYGTSGSIGSFAVQLAKLFGAEVTAVCSSSKKELVQSLGADRVIDYTKEDFTKKGESYDIIFDTIGKSPYSGSVRSLKKKGRYLLANPTVSQMVRGIWTSMRSSKRVMSEFATYKTEDLLFLKELIEKGKLQTVIDRCYRLEEIVQAHHYVEKGHKKGNVIITVEE